MKKLLAIYVFYQKTDPFAGWIRMTGQVDPDQISDGSTLKERLDQLLIKYPDSAIKLLPVSELPDPEVVKYDTVAEAFVPLEAGDITPKAQRILDQETKAQALIDNLPSWAQVDTAIDNISNLGEAKAFIRKLSRVTYWIAKDAED